MAKTKKGFTAFELPAADLKALRTLAATLDRSVSSLLRQSVRELLRDAVRS